MQSLSAEHRNATAPDLALPRWRSTLRTDAVARARLIDRIALVLTALASMAYAWLAIVEAHRPYWMDEVLAVWTARQPGIGAVWEALKHGAEFSPPLYHVLLWTIVHFGFDDPVALRLTSIAAIYVVALAAFVLVRRRFPVAIACLALVACLSGLLFSYAVQARQYACVTACFALACTLWDGTPERRVSVTRALGIAALLSIAIGMHFYAVLLVGAFGLMEVIWMARYRRIRWPIVLALFAAAGSILLWLPIIQAVSSFNHADTAAPDYYARPTGERLFATYYGLLTGGGALPPVMLGATVVAFGARIHAGRLARSLRPHLAIIAFGALAFPALVFAFAVLVTGTFNARYLIVAALGLSLVIAQCTAAHRHGTVIACGLIAAAAASFLVGAWSTHRLRRQEPVDLIARAPEGLPIATGNGLHFLEMYEGADRAVARRLVFLMVPSLDRSPDPTNDHQVQRWARIDPSLPIKPVQDFLSTSPDFLVFTDPAFPDMIPDDLRARGYVLQPVAEQAGMTVHAVRRPAAVENQR